MDTQSPREPTDLRAYLDPIWSRRWMILLVVVAATAATYFYSTTRPEKFTAATTVFVQVSELDRALFGAAADVDPDRNTVNISSLLRSRAVARRVAEELDFKGEPIDLVARIAIERREGSDFITIQATDSTPRRAAALANAFAASLIELREATTRRRVRASRQVAKRELAQLADTPRNRAARRALRSQIRRLEVIESLPAGRVEQIDRAIPPDQASAPKPKRNAAFAFVLSSLLACGAAILLARVDRTLRRPDEVEELYGLPMLATVPHGDPAPTDSEGGALISDRHREAFRTLRANLELQGLDRPLRTILVTSALPGEGKSSIVRNLALTYREAGLRVAVIEADLRQPSLPALFRLRRDPGFTDVLSQQASPTEALQTVAVGNPERTLEAVAPPDAGSNGHGRARLVVMTSGPNPANPPAVLGATRAHEVLREIASDHDIVLIDSPPLLAVSDAIPLLSVVDGVLLVARPGLTKRDAARRVVELIARVPDARVVGVVANDVPEGRVPYSYYQYS